MSIRDYADVLISTIEHLFPKGTAEVQGKVFLASVRITIDDFGDEEERAAVLANIHLAVVAESNYVAVYAAASRLTGRWPEKAWGLLARHDSAWRDDGVRNALCGGHEDLMQVAIARFGKPVKSLSEHRSVDFMGILPVAEVFGPIAPSAIPRRHPDMAAAAAE